MTVLIFYHSPTLLSVFGFSVFYMILKVIIIAIIQMSAVKMVLNTYPNMAKNAWNNSLHTKIKMHSKGTAITSPNMMPTIPMFIFYLS